MMPLVCAIVGRKKIAMATRLLVDVTTVVVESRSKQGSRRIWCAS
jgi:hypothetical protein